MKTIEYKVSYEKMISRLPGLFAYLDSDEFGTVSLHKATDSLNGCYGKLVENITLPTGVNCNNPFYSLCYQTNCYINYSTSKIIEEYDYQQLTSKEAENYSLNENSKIISQAEFEELCVLDENDEIDEVKTQDKKNTYSMLYVNNITFDEYITVKEYEQKALKGGNTYTFRTLISYYYEYKDYLNDNNPFKKFIERGIGKITVDEEYLLDNDIVPKFIYLSDVRRFYNEIIKIHKRCEYYNLGLQDHKLNKDKHFCCLCERYEKMNEEPFFTKFKNYLIGLISLADEIATEYYGYTAQKTMELEFAVDLTSSYEDLGIVTPYIPQWIPGRKYKKGDKVVYNDELYICTCKENEFTTGEWNEIYQMIVFDTKNFMPCQNGMTCYDDNDKPEQVFNPFVIEGKTDSKLTDLRRFSTYFDENNVSQMPKYGYDWLYYYRVKQNINIGTSANPVYLYNVVNIRTKNDELGNILNLTDGKTATSKVDNLAAYGDIIENIIVNQEEYTITFVYRTGVHLISEKDPDVITDDDGNKLYKWRYFTWDENVKIGTKYQETYNYVKGGDLDKLINGELKITDENNNQVTFNFNDYIMSKYDVALQNYKFEFMTYGNSFSYTKTIAHQDVNIVSILTDFELYRNDFSEFENAELFREDYLNGISYSPTKDISVKISRGSTSVFDKHIRFSEIKTYEDIVNYQNGSFFNINES